MDPYLGSSSFGPTSMGGGMGGMGGMGPMMDQPMRVPSSGISPKMLAIVGCCLLLVGIIVFFVMRQTKIDPPESLPMVGNASSKSQGKTQTTTVTGPVDPMDPNDEKHWATDPPEARLAMFAFEPRLRPGFVPNQDGRLERKPAGNAPYKLVACDNANGYAIRWMGRYLTVISPNSLQWTEQKEEPGSCFKLVPGYCGAGNNYVMIRSVANKLFVRNDEPSGILVCKDVPTARTANAFCWKLNPDSTGQKQPCGQIYSYDLGRIVDVPCNVKEMPSGGESCSTVTKGYQASCCIRRAGTATHDAFCEATIFPKVVGRSLQEALLYIRTRRPDLSLKPCPEPCTTQAIPIQNPNLVVIPYDARSMLVTGIPRRLI